MTRPICIYHGGCADGFTAAWAVWRRFGDAFDYFAATYGDAPPDVIGRDVVMVDFSYKRDVINTIAESANTILILDHHKTAEADLAGFAAPVGEIYDPARWRWSYEKTAEIPVRAVFDMNRSGAGLAWDFFHDPEARPALVRYVEDRDLWRFDLPHSREINAFIFAHHYDFDEWETLAAELDQAPLEEVAALGAAIEKKHHKDVAELVAEMRREVSIGGFTVPAANLPKTLTSDAGHLMAVTIYESGGEKVLPHFAACYWDTAEGRIFSLRSVDGGADVSEIAKQYGGGGHKHAAGFRVSFDELAQFEVA